MEVEEAGRWYFRRDILETLEEYFAYIWRMKAADRDSYESKYLLTPPSRWYKPCHSLASRIAPAPARWGMGIITLT